MQVSASQLLGIVLEEEKETFVLGKLPNWGEIIIPREMFLGHALPIFLRESEKISHRNLPKALLNCWWLEMIVCIGDYLRVSSAVSVSWHTRSTINNTSKQK